MTSPSVCADARALPPAEGIAVIVLLEDEDEARSVAHLVEDVQGPAGHSTPLVPPVRGLDFFADPGAQPIADRWWGDHVPPRALPLWIVGHRDGLEGWIGSVDGLFVVVGDEVELYAGSPRVTCVPSAAPLDVLGAVTRELGLLPQARTVAPEKPATRTAPARRRLSRSRFRRAELRAGEDVEPADRARGSAQLFEPTVPRRQDDADGLCHELIAVLGDAMHRIRALSTADVR